MKREGVEKKRDRDRVVLENENYTYFGTNFKSSNYLFWDRESLCIMEHTH